MLFAIAWRNIWRHTGRSLTIIGSVVLGIWAILFLNSLYEGMIRQRIADVIGLESAHLQVHHPDFRADWDPKFGITHRAEAERWLRSDPRVKAISLRQLSSGMINSPGGSFGIRISGVLPRDEARVSAISQQLVEGKYLQAEQKREIIVGRALAERLKLKLRSKVVLLCQDINGDIASGAFRVVGIYRTNNLPFDESRVFIHRNQLSALLGTGERIHEIGIVLHDQEQTDAVKQHLSSRLPGDEVLTWMEITPEMRLLVGMFDEYMLVFMLIVFCAVAFGIINTMLMSVLERTRELGMMVAIGMNRPRVFGMVTLETLLLMLAGMPFGIGAGVLTVWYTGRNGIRFGSEEMMSNFGFDQVIYPVLTGTQVMQTSVVITLITILSSLYPSYKAIHIKPAEAIRK